MFLCVIAALVLLNRPIATLAQQQAGDDQGTQASPEEPQVFTTLSGGAVEQIRLRNNDLPTTLAVLNGPFVGLPGATLPWTIGAGDSDLIGVTFNAECALLGGGANPLTEWVEARAVIFAAPARAGYPKLMSPAATAPSSLALCGDAHYTSISTTWHDRPTPVGVPTTYTAVVQWRLHAATAGEQGWLDDWTMALTAYN